MKRKSAERTHNYETRIIEADDRLHRSGLEVMRAIRDGELPMAAIADTLDFRLVEVEHGLVTFTAEPQRFAYNMLGAMHGGWTATLLDSAMGCAVHSVMKPRFGYTTVDLTINYVRPVTTATGTVRAEGKVLHAGRRIATAEGKLVSAEGKLLAHGLTTCMIFSLEAGPLSP
jgi:uncharacterized protein (TIGR00369 family)